MSETSLPQSNEDETAARSRAMAEQSCDSSTSGTPATQDPTQEEKEKEAYSQSRETRSEEPIYRNSLLLFVGYFDFTNALDFPANVWNQAPLPLHAVVLMALGGSVAILAVGFAIWDMVRCHRNITFLRRERAGLLFKNSERGLVEKAWLAINTRELCWEIFDRFLLDLFMGVTGLLVGTGTIMAIKGPDNRRIFDASNDLSGYVGNAFLAVYACINAVWAVVMWLRAHRNQAAMRRAEGIERGLRLKMKHHAWKHQMYSVVNGVTLVFSGAASLVSATMWQGYVPQVPLCLMSIAVVHFWRFCMGYDRLSYQARRNPGTMDVHERVKAVIDLRVRYTRGLVSTVFSDLSGSWAESSQEAVIDALYDMGLGEDFERRFANAPEKTTVAAPARASCPLPAYLEGEQTPLSTAIQSCIDAAGLRRIKYEGRFMLELYGYYLREQELAQTKNEA